MFDNLNYFGGTKNYVYRRRLLISSIYRVKKWNLKFTPFPPTSRRDLPPLLVCKMSLLGF